MASTKAKLLDGYLDEKSQTKQISAPTPKPTGALWEKYGMTNPMDEYLAPADRTKPLASDPGKSNIVSAPSAPKSGGIIPVTDNSITNPVQSPASAMPQTNQTPSSPTNTPVDAPVTDAGPSIQDMINQLMDTQRQSRYAALDKARDTALATLDERASEIPEAYYNLKNQAAAQSDVGAMNFAQYMAGRGIKGAAAGMPEIYRNAALQGNIGRLDSQQQADLSRIARDRTGVLNAYESDYASAGADIDAMGLQAMINQMNTDRTYNYQLGRDQVVDNQWQQNFDQNKSQQAFENEYRNRTFDESVRQFEMNYGLNLKQFSLQEAQQRIDNAYRQGQLSMQQAQMAMDEAKFIYQKERDERDFNYQIKQDAIKNNQPSPTKPLGASDYKTNPDFAADVQKIISYIKVAPENMKLAEQELINNSQSYISTYGYDGFQELMRIIKAGGY